MAEHLRHTLVRSGAPIRTSSIQTLGQFVDQWSPLAAAPLALLHLLIEQELERLPLPRFARVAGLPGFTAALAGVLANALPADAPEEIVRLHTAIGLTLRARGMGWRQERLRPAADRAPARQTVLDGFFTLSDAETQFVVALSARAPVTVTLPEWPGAAEARRALLAAGFEERPATASSGCGTASGDRPGMPPTGLPGSSRDCRQTLFTAPTIEREAAAIAARIRDEVTRGRPFREMGVVLRVRDPYAPLLATTFDRHAIPARFYFTDPLAAHPAVAYLAQIVRAWLAGWDHALLLPALRMPVSGLGATPAGDALDFALRKTLPDAGLIPELLSKADFTPRGTLAPAEWAAHLKRLRALLPTPQPTGHDTRDQIHVWRSTSAAMSAFEEALDATAAALGDAPCPLAVFWRQAETTLALEPLRLADQRRDVVHVMDAYEARQWQLPLVFVCGLTERHFPQYHRIDPILRDAAALAEKQMEEPFLFGIATTRATEETILSYPRYDEQGQETLPSFFLAGRSPAPALETVVRGGAGPRPVVAAQAASTGAEQSPPVHNTLSPSAIESFLQCPFQFFARYTLKLHERPAAPRDRLDVLLQGSILHRALAELADTPLLGAAVLDRVFEEECADHRIPLTYRAEAVRLELLRHFTAFLEDDQVSLPGWRARAEEQFTFALHPGLAIRGRIDRLEVSADGRALVIDYKYSAGDKIKDRIERTESGEQVQGGLYLAAAERAFGLKPAGMLYCGLKKGVNWDGWHASVAGLEQVGEQRTEAALRELMRDAEQAAQATHEAISQGRIAPHPADRDKCRWCDFRDICRIESAAAVEKVGGA